MIITIGREFGSGGDIIGKRLAQRLGIKYYDKETLAREARKSDQYQELKSFFEEEPINSLLFVIAMDSNTERQRKIPFEFIQKLAKGEECVIVGRCGNYILRNNTDMTSIFIHAPERYRIEKIAEDCNISIAKAKKLVEKEDRARAGFHKYYANQVWNSADCYHFSFDSSVMGIDESVDMIIDFVDKKEAYRKR